MADRIYKEFINNLLAMTPQQLAQQHQTIGEMMMEEESHTTAHYYRLQLNVVSSIGRLIHPTAFDDAMENLK